MIDAPPAINQDVLENLHAFHATFPALSQPNGHGESLERSDGPDDNGTLLEF